MARKTIVLMPSAEYALGKMGVRIKRARLRRNIRAELLAERAGISKGTFSAIEKGTPTVSIGAYIAVLCVLDMEGDLELVAMDEEGKEKYQESILRRRKRATKVENRE